MSKIVKSVTRAVSKVVKGAVKAVTGVVKGVVNVVKKVASSPIGKILIGAAALYFGVPMISGALGGASAAYTAAGTAGSGFFGTIGSTLSGAFTGAGAGLQQAWTGLTGALTGGGFEALSKGFSPEAAFSAGGNTVPGAFPPGSGILTNATGQGAGLTAPGATTGGTAGSGLSAPGMGGSSGFQAINPTMSPTNYSLSGAGGAPSVSMAGQADLLAGNGLKYIPSAAAGGAPGAAPGVLANMWNSPYTAPALIQAGGQVVGAVGSGIAQKAAAEEQERLAEEDRARRSYNVGTPLFAMQPAVQFGRG